LVVVVVMIVIAIIIAINIFLIVGFQHHKKLDIQFVLKENS